MKTSEKFPLPINGDLQGRYLSTKIIYILYGGLTIDFFRYLC